MQESVQTVLQGIKKSSEQVHSIEFHMTHHEIPQLWSYQQAVTTAFFNFSFTFVNQMPKAPIGL